MMLFRKIAEALHAAPPAASHVEPGRAEPAHDCALWHDISRALEQAPRSTRPGRKGGGTAARGAASRP